MSDDIETGALEDLQSRLTFQEETLQQLNQVVARQTNQIEQLEQQLQVLAAKYRDLRDAVEEGPAAPGGPADERPPHY